MGAVYEGLHVEIGKRVAIKAMARRRGDAEARAPLPARGAADVARPAPAHGRRHRHRHRGRPAFLVMEFLEGEDLAERLAAAGTAAARGVVDIMLPVCSAVAAAHDEGVIHRDLKPQNIFLAQHARRDHPAEGARLRHLEGAGHAPIRDRRGAILGIAQLLRAGAGHDPKATPGQRSVRARRHPLRVRDRASADEGSNLAAIFQGIVTGNSSPPGASSRPAGRLPAGRSARAMSLAPADRFSDPAADGAGAARIRVAADAAPVARSFQRGGHDRAATDGESIAGAGHGSDAGPERLPLSSTAFIGGARPPPDGRAGCAAGWILPVRSPLPSSSDPLLEVRGDFIPRAGRSAPADWPRRGTHRRARVAWPPANGRRRSSRRSTGGSRARRGARRRTSRSRTD